MRFIFFYCFAVFTVLSQATANAQTPQLLEQFASSLLSPEEYAVINGVAYFAARTSTEGTELWRSDGTPQGTYLLKDINPGSTSSRPARFSVLNNRLIFLANDGVNGDEFWVSDGTSAGTQILKDINPGSQEGIERDFITSAIPQFEYKGELYFFAQVGNTFSLLWKTDGTESGTIQVKNVCDNCAPTNVANGEFGILNNYLYFKVSDGIWRTDGTSTGTIRAIYGNVSPYVPSVYNNPRVCDNRLYFAANDPNDFTFDLWYSDGTIAGCKKVKDFPENAKPRKFTFLQGKVYFIADNSFWVTDGSENGTVMFSNLKADEINLGKNDFYIWDNKLYFKAVDTDNKAYVYELNPVNNEVKQIASQYYRGDKFGKVYFSSNENYLFFDEVSDQTTGKIVRLEKNTGAVKKISAEVIPQPIILLGDNVLFRNDPVLSFPHGIWIIPALSVSNQELTTPLNAHIFPNPSSDGRFYATAPDHTPVTARVFDALGKLVLQQSFTGNTYLQVPDPIPGIYYVHLIADDGAAAIQQVSILR